MRFSSPPPLPHLPNYWGCEGSPLVVIVARMMTPDILTVTRQAATCPTDVELVRRVAAGDSRAFGELYGRYRGLIHSEARRATKSAHDAEDAAADAMLAVLRAIRNGRGPTDGSVGGYFITAVRRAASIRRAMRQPRVVDDLANCADELPATAATRPDRWIDDLDPAVRTALESLPPRWAQILVQIDVVGRPTAELSTELGISRNAVAALSLRARNGLRRQLEPMRTLTPARTTP